MTHYLKSTLAHLPPNLQSLEQYRSRLRLPNPTPYYDKGNKLQSKHPRVFVGIAILVFLLFWKDIICDSFSHISLKKTAAVIEQNPILNSTLGVSLLRHPFCSVTSELTAPTVSRDLRSLPARPERSTGASSRRCKRHKPDYHRDRCHQRSADTAVGLAAVVGNERMDTKGGRARLLDVACPDVAKVSICLPAVTVRDHTDSGSRMIYENITSALIMESDVDWDMRIKQSMVGVGRGTKAIADWPFDPPPSPEPSATKPSSTEDVPAPQPRPYGDKWDILWLGHCGSSANGDGRIYAFNDTAAPDEDHAWAYGERPAEGHRPPGTRIVYQLDKTVCTTSYAISNKGARKFEKLFQEANSPIDLKIWDACANSPDLACIGVWPQVISMTESRTNIKHSEGGLSFGKEITEEKIVAGKAIQVSSRMNARLGTADKGPEGWTWEWRDGEKTEDGQQKDREAAEREAESRQSETKGDGQDENQEGD